MFDGEGKKIKKIKENRWVISFRETFKDRSLPPLGQGAFYGF